MNSNTPQQPDTAQATPWQQSGKPVILMCSPDYFDVVYAINAWMDRKNPVDKELARRQWEALYNAIGEAGAEVALIDPVDGLPDMVFTANAAFVYDNKAIVARYKHPERQGEEPHAAKWFQSNGFETIILPEGMYFEGSGDALIWHKKVFAGYKARSCVEAHSMIATKTDLQVISLALEVPKYYHVDVCLCPLENGDCIYYPGAFNAYGQQLFELNVPAANRIEIHQAEAENFGANAISIGDTVIFNEGCDQLAADLKARGLKPVQVNLSEFIKAGGSAKCMTLRLV